MFPTINKRKISYGKVFIIHHFELNPGVEAAEFERFVNGEVYPVTERPDLTLYERKGDSGERKGKYFFMLESESEESHSAGNAGANE